MSRIRNTLVIARVSSEEKRALFATAVRRGLTVSELIRSAIDRSPRDPKWSH